MELVIGGMAGVGAGIFTNPLEVVKIRMQLQGELQKRGKYTVHYRNTFHAAYVIGRKEGLRALQKGLVPALFYQFVLNGTRLGTYQLLEKQGFTRTRDGKVSNIGSLVGGAGCGTFAAIIGSPFYLVKTHLQATSAEKAIAVGYQHSYHGMSHALRQIYRDHGVGGLWRGSTSAVPRVCVASAVQLMTFEKSLEFVRGSEFGKKYGPWTTALMASLISGIFVSVAMAPFDLVATRFYNQGVDGKGTGLLYRSVLDCMKKIYSEEGLFGFYKGWSANYFRLGPHTLLTLVFWDRMKHYYKNYQDNTPNL